MPYKDKEKDKERLRKYYEKNKELVKKRGRDWYKENKDRVLSQHQEKKEELKVACKTWRKENKDKIKKYKQDTIERRIAQWRKDKKNAIENLKDWYVVNIISKATGVPVAEIRKNPELVEEFRYKIKIKRALREFSKKINKTKIK